MATVKQIFESIDNASVNYTMSAIPYAGRTIEQWNKVIETRANLSQHVAAGTLAAKLLESDSHLTVKQLWVIAYALQNNAEYCAQLDAKKANQNTSAAKLAANKAASADVLAQLQQAGKLLKDYYAWLKISKFKKEFYNKKYSAASVDAFLNL